MAKVVNTNINTVRNSTKTAACTCKSTTQDAMFGKGVRVMNATKAGFKCTVCGAKK